MDVICCILKKEDRSDLCCHLYQIPFWEGYSMCKAEYDITYGDLNPTFLFSWTHRRTEDESNYHSHEFIELVIILRGEGNFVINGEKLLVKEGDMILLNPGTYHKSLVGTGCARGATECYVAFTDVDFKGCERGYLPLFKGKDLIMSMPDGLKQDIFRLCGAIEKEYQTYETGRYFMLKAYLIQVLCLIQREEHEERVEVEQKGYIFRSVNKKYVVRKIKKYLDEHYREKVSLDQIADNMYLSPVYISKLFKHETGDTPINYLIDLRMEKAREIIEQDPAASIQAVALAVGYEDAYHFSKLFKKHYGMSPLHYKTQYTKQS